MNFKATLFLISVIILQACNQSDKIEYEYSTIPMIPDGGIYRMPCEINGLPLKFIFDTGASDVSISKTEAIFMIKNDFIEVEDLKDKVSYSMANGDIQEGVKLILKEVKVGDIVLNDVSATIMDNDNAPILLGQSVLNQLGVLIVDYSKNEMSFIKGEFNVGSLINEHNSTSELQEQNRVLRSKLTENSDNFNSEKSSLNERVKTQRQDLLSLEGEVTQLKEEVGALRAENRRLRQQNKARTQSKPTERSTQTKGKSQSSTTAGGGKVKSTKSSNNTSNTNSLAPNKNETDFSKPISYVALTSVKNGTSRLYKSIQAKGFFYSDIDKYDEVYILYKATDKMAFVMVRGTRGYMKIKDLKYKFR